MDYIVGRGGLACEFETYFGPHKFLEIHETSPGIIGDCRVFNNRYEAYDASLFKFLCSQNPAVFCDSMVLSS